MIKKISDLEEENKKMYNDLDCSLRKESSMQIEFRDKQRELCSKLRSALSEKNDLLNSVEKLQKHLEQVCIENSNKEKENKEFAEQCSLLKHNVRDSFHFIKKNQFKSSRCHVILFPFRITPVFVNALSFFNI